MMGFMVVSITGWWFGSHQFYFPRNIGLLIIPIDELIFFRGVAQPPTRLDPIQSHQIPIVFPTLDG